MKYKIYYSRLLEAIANRVSPRSVLVKTLVDILSLEREAVYRRLRGEVPFSFKEVVAIAKSLNISLDNLINDDYESMSPFQMNIIEHFDPSDMDYVLMERVVDVMEDQKYSDFSRGGEITEILPQPLYFPYENITRFYLFKWMCQYGPVQFKNVTISKRVRDLQMRNVKVSRFLRTTDYVFERCLFYSLIEEIRYYRDIHLIRPEEVCLIKEELLCILDDIQKLTETGRFEDTGNRIRIYIADIMLDASYCYIETDNLTISIVKAFILNGIISYDPKTYKMLSNWLLSIKRQSLLISVNSEKHRISYLNQQRAYIESL